MNLFELSWTVVDGLNEYYLKEHLVFRDENQAALYGEKRAYEMNAEKKAVKSPSQKECKNAEEHSANHNGRIFRFEGAHVFAFAFSSEGKKYQLSISESRSE